MSTALSSGRGPRSVLQGPLFVEVVRRNHRRDLDESKVLTVRRVLRASTCLVASLDDVVAGTPVRRQVNDVTLYLLDLPGDHLSSQLIRAIVDNFALHEEQHGLPPD